MTPPTALEQRILIWAPTGHDAASIGDLLGSTGIVSHIVTSMADFSAALSVGAGVAFIAREALVGPVLDDLERRLQAEPGWSKLPIVLVTWKGAERGAQLFALADRFGSVANVIFLERPFASDVLLGSVRFALRSRLAQYQLRDITNRLDASAEALQRSNRDLEHFASVAAHDLQEPLRTMGSYAQLLQKRYAAVLDEPGRQFCDRISDGAQRMTAIIRSIKEFSLATQSDRGGHQAVDLGQVVAECRLNMQQVITEREAEIRVGALPTVTGDPIQLVVLFQNLIGNAIKYTPVAPVVDVTATEVAEGWRITVSDNGPGIAPQDHERIFEIFTRLNAIGVSGSGIGLATCRRVVERHGGRIGVESTPGTGATFWVILPKT